MDIALNDIKARIERIENLIAVFNPEQASKEMLQLVRDFRPELKNNALKLSADYYKWKKMKTEGMYRLEELDIIINRFLLGILDLCDEMIQTPIFQEI